MAESPERRQAGDLYRRQPRAEGRRLSAWAATADRQSASQGDAGGAGMSRVPFIVIDGKPYRWKDILDQRRAQLAAAGAAQASQEGGPPDPNFTTLKHMAHNLIRKAPGKDRSSS